MILTLERFCYGPNGTFGQLALDGNILYTVERPWLDNKVGISCIPPGKYECKLSYFHHGGYEAYEITDVKDRTRILIHIANTMDDVKGCIGLGFNLGYIKNRWAVTSSKNAFKFFMEKLNGEDFTLIIKGIVITFNQE